MQAELKFINAGLQTTLQDSGRTGFRKFGIANNGCLDLISQQLANWLVGKPSHSAVFEITQTGPLIKAQNDVSIGVAGAKFELFLNELPIENHQTIHLRKDDTLRFGKLIYGARAYLAVAGEIVFKPVLNSASTNLLAQFGGMNGQAISNNTIVKIESTYTPETRQIPTALYQEFEYSNDKTKVIRLIIGREFEKLTLASQQNFFDQIFTINSSSNRMALILTPQKLEEISLVFNDAISMTTVPIISGTIQLPNDGKPIITLADGQTTGGYPRIGQVITADLSVLAQLKAGDMIRFYPVSVEKAQSILHEKLSFIDKRLTVLNQDLC